MDVKGALPNGEEKCLGALEKYSDSVVRIAVIY